MEAPTLLKPGESEQTVSHALQPLFACSIAFLVLNTITVVLRFFTVLKLRRPRVALTWDDWFLLPGYVTVTAMIACGLVIYHIEVEHVPEAHQVVLQPSVLEPILKTIFAVPILAVWTYFFTRLSILYLFLRLFPGKVCRTAIYILIAFISVQTLAYTIATLTVCLPTSYFWRQASPEGERGMLDGRCGNLDAFYRSITPPNIVSDVLLIVLPMPEVWRLNVTRARRAGLTLLFGTGLACLVATAFRLYNYAHYTGKLIAPVLTNSLLVWLVVEPSIYLIAACLLAMHPLFRLAVPRNWLRSRADDAHAARTDFTRLVETEGSSAAAAGTRAPNPHGRPGLRGKGSRDDASMHGSTRADSALEMEAVGKSDVPVDQLREVTGGMGVLVTTEISVTTEERIERVLGI